MADPNLGKESREVLDVSGKETPGSTIVSPQRSRWLRIMGGNLEEKVPD